MKKIQIFSINADQANKINCLLPKGYKILTLDEYKKKINQSKKKTKVVYHPIEQITPPQSRRNKMEVSYYQGDDDGVDKKRNVYYDSEKNVKNFDEDQWKQPEKQPKNRNTESVKQKNLSFKSSSFAPPQSTVNSLSPKQVIELFEKHEKFKVIKQFEEEYGDKCDYANIVRNIDQGNYSVQSLMVDMQNLFINIYGQYPRTSSMYFDTAILEGHLNYIIEMQNNFPKEIKEQIAAPQQNKPAYPPPIQEQMPVFPELNRSFSFQKNNTIPIKSDLKSITIMDKRILGRNIKKLPPEYLAQICRIVFDTIQTREEYIIDIESLPLKKVKELQIYVNSCLQKNIEFELQNQERNEEDSSESFFIITDDDDEEEEKVGTKIEN